MVLERSKSVVALEFVVEREIDRQQGFAYGLVVDDQGTIVVLESIVLRVFAAHRESRRNLATHNLHTQIPG